MLHDALDAGVPVDRQADIAIVGAGPAGITLAMQLQRDFDVLLLEAGPTGAANDAAAYLDGEVHGLDYDLTATRARNFGGSTALWAGYCAIFDPLDFAARPWVLGSGWPVDAGEVLAHVPAAARLLHVDDACFDVDDLGRENAGAALLPDQARFQLGVWRFGEPKADFGGEYHVALARSTSTQVLTSACVTDIRLTTSGSAVDQLEVRTPAGRTGTIRARVFVLAAGGLETPRLMLASNRQRTEGVGNASGHVGRWFMEHPHVTLRGVEIPDRPGTDAWTGRGRAHDGRVFTFCAGMKAQEQQRQEVLNARTHLFRTPRMEEDEPPRVGLFFEQAPNPASRVTLSGDTDPLGLPRVQLDWQLSPLDHRSHHVYAEILTEALARRGIARVCGSPGLTDEVLFSNHQLGTTRMSRDPSDGVVDPNCRVHGIDNLFIVGGSVFPTVSWANPTVTVLALTLRLASHLANVLAPM